jgi:hypothetical protein
MSSPQNVGKKLDGVYRKMRSVRRRVRVGSWLTVIIGLVLLGLVGFYFTYGYTQISGFQDPELLVSLVGQTVDDQIPIVRRRLEDEVKNNASTWAQQTSEQVLAAAPTIREELEKHIVEQTDTLIDELEVIGDKEFKRLLSENRSTLADALEQLKDEKEVSDGTMVLLEEAIEKEFKISMEDQAAALLTIVSDAHKNMKMLQKGENLTPAQERERRALMLARRLQLIHLGDVRIEDLAPAGVTEAVEKLEAERLQKKAEDAKKG